MTSDQFSQSLRTKLVVTPKLTMAGSGISSYLAWYGFHVMCAVGCRAIFNASSKAAIRDPWLSAPSLTAVVLLAVFQVLSPPASSDRLDEFIDRQAPANPTAEPTDDLKQGREVPILSNTMSLNSAALPIAGSPDAKYIVVELLDYTCSDCRQTHKILEKVDDSYGEDFAVLVLPVPLNSKCNENVRVNRASHAEACELAKIAITVWQTAPEKFRGFHNWMMQGKTAPTAKTARAKALEIVDADEFNQEWNSNRADKYIQKNVQLFKRAGAREVPTIFFPGTTFSGQITSVDLFKRLIREQFQ